MTENVSSEGSNERTGRLVIVSNRLPLVLAKDEHEAWQARPASGGLVTALTPVLRARGGTWVGFPGAVEEECAPIERLLAEANENASYRCAPVTLTRAEQDRYYYGFSNEILWPLFHDLQSRTNFDPAYWRAYQAVNDKFARAIAQIAHPSDFIWVQDYHLMLVARALRRTGVAGHTGFFLHIPFPPPDIFIKLPWRFEILYGLLSYNLVGLQTLRDTRNLLACIHMMLPGAGVHERGSGALVEVGGQQALIGTFPISIDCDEFAAEAASDAVGARAQQLRARYADRQIVLGVDRLDYTKGIVQKLLAFREALDLYPDLRERVSLLQIVVPSRACIPGYRDLRLEVERLVSEINGALSEPGWVPIHYLCRNLPRAELLALYRAARIALVTPLKDGMNLVAKEYCVSNVDDDGVLVLSEFAGAAAQMQYGALLVNPYDRHETAEALYAAYGMGAGERRRRMRALRRSVREQDIYWWVECFLHAAVSRHEASFPQVEDYVPSPRLPERAPPALLAAVS